MQEIRQRQEQQMKRDQRCGRTDCSSYLAGHAGGKPFSGLGGENPARRSRAIAVASCWATMPSRTREATVATMAKNGMEAPRSAPPKPG